MKIHIKDMWSPDLNPPSTGLPPDSNDFRILAQIAIGVAGQAGHEVFSLQVCSSSALARIESGTFITDTLVLEQFSWANLRHRLEKLIMQCDGCRDWAEVIRRLSGCLRYDDAA